MRSDEELLMQGACVPLELLKLRRKEMEKLLKIEKDKEWSKLIGDVSEKCDWRYDNAIEFVSDLLQDCNFHTARKYVVRCMVDEDW